MKTVEYKYICDICGEEACVHERIQAVFTTNQTDGSSRSPYRCSCDMDLCGSCNERSLHGEQIRAHGAQGVNTYSFFEDFQKMRHYIDSTVGLYATDMRDKITEDDEIRLSLFKLKF